MSDTNEKCACVLVGTPAERIDRNCPAHGRRYVPPAPPPSATCACVTHHANDCKWWATRKPTPPPSADGEAGKVLTRDEYIEQINDFSDRAKPNQVISVACIRKCLLAHDAALRAEVERLGRIVDELESPAAARADKAQARVAELTRERDEATLAGRIAECDAVAAWLIAERRSDFPEVELLHMLELRQNEARHAKEKA
jgi:hypothetical protein